MIEVKYFKKGTIVYSIVRNIIIKLIVEDVFIDTKEHTIIYSLREENSMNTLRLNSELVFDDLELLREDIIKQFDKLIPKDIGKCTEEKEEIVS